MIKDWTLLGLTLALVALLAGVAVFPHWLAFLVMISLARGLVVLGLVLQMRAGLVSFGQGLYYCIGGYAAAMLGSLYGIHEVAILAAAAVLLSAAVAIVLGCTALPLSRDLLRDAEHGVLDDPLWSAGEDRRSSARPTVSTYRR